MTKNRTCKSRAFTYILLIIALTLPLFAGCPADPTGGNENGGGNGSENGGGSGTEGENNTDGTGTGGTDGNGTENGGSGNQGGGEEEFPDWNKNGVDDRNESLVLGAGDNEPLIDLREYLMYYAAQDTYEFDVSAVDTTQVPDMAYLFHHIDTFNYDISDLDISHATSLEGMFAGATQFDQDLSSWVIANGVSTFGMFDDTPMQDKVDWHPKGCACHPNLPHYPDWNNNNTDDRVEGLAPQDKAKLKQILDYYADNTRWGFDITTVDTTNIIDTSEMFSGWSKNYSLTGLDVSSVEHMRGMFLNASLFNQDISGWTVDQVTDFSLMFFNATTFDQDLSGWDITGKDSAQMFDGTAMEDKVAWHPVGCACGASGH